MNYLSESLIDAGGDVDFNVVGCALDTPPGDILAHSESRIRELLEHANRHVDLVLDRVEAELQSDLAELDRSSENGAQIVDAEPRSSPSYLSKIVGCSYWLKKPFRIVTSTSSNQYQHARFERYELGHQRLRQHLVDTKSTQTRLSAALSKFAKHAGIIAFSIPQEPRDSRLMTTSLHSCFTQTRAHTEALQSSLNAASSQTAGKLQQVESLRSRIIERTQLMHDVVNAHRKLNIREPKTTNKFTTPLSVCELNAEQREAEYHTLRRRAVALTTALEHVFAFHVRIDPHIVEPELAQVHQKLLQFWAKHTRVLDKNVNE